MSTSVKNTKDIIAKDPIDKLIFEKGLRINRIIIEKELDLIAIILNTGKIIESRISYFPRLQKASEKELKNWKLISNGIGIRWENLDEDLSVKGFIKTAAINEMLEHLQAPPGR